ncbi:Ribonuclease H superfamily [Sesbania bispinosa]|nr:Ribonuclease H superfamily [Sesbania bispinosa]
MQQPSNHPGGKSDLSGFAHSWQEYSSKLGWTRVESLRIASLWASQRVCTRSIFCALNAQNGVISVRVSSLISIFFDLSLSAYEKHTSSPSNVLRYSSVQAPTTPTSTVLSVRCRPCSFGVVLAVSGVVPTVSGELFVHAFSCLSAPSIHLRVLHLHAWKGLLCVYLNWADLLCCFGVFIWSVSVTPMVDSYESTSRVYESSLRSSTSLRRLSTKGKRMEKVPEIEEIAEPPALPPPPPDVLPNMETEQMAPTKYSIISRLGVGTTGKCIPLLANLFKVASNAPDAIFFQYSVTITSEDKRTVESKVIRRKVIEWLYQMYSSELGGKRFAYDGEKTLYTVGPLPQNKFEHKILLEESLQSVVLRTLVLMEALARKLKGLKRSFQSKAFMVEISFATKIPLQSVALSLKGIELDANCQDALRVLDIVLRQRAANRGCLLVRQSFFHDDSSNFTDIGGGVTGVQGLHSSFRLTEGGLSLNMDVSTTVILKPGPVIDFLLSNQNVREPRYIDWAKAVGNYCYDDDPVLGACGISVDKQLTPVEGRVLETPKTLLQPSHIDFWAVVNFSAPCDTSYITRELIKCGMSKGINIERPYTLIEEESQLRKSNPVARVEKMFDLLISKLTKEPKLILCVLPERKNCDIYAGRYKFSADNRAFWELPLIKDTPTMILGMDVSHGSPGQSHIPSIAAVRLSDLGVWPLISRYRASVRTQSSKVEIINALYKPLENGNDDGIISTHESLEHYGSMVDGVEDEKYVEKES